MEGREAEHSPDLSIKCKKANGSHTLLLQLLLHRGLILSGGHSARLKVKGTQPEAGLSCPAFIYARQLWALAFVLLLCPFLARHHHMASVYGHKTLAVMEPQRSKGGVGGE